MDGYEISGKMMLLGTPKLMNKDYYDIIKIGFVGVPKKCNYLSQTLGIRFLNKTIKVSYGLESSY